MSCENKLTNLVFKNKENSARIQCASFSFLPYIYIYIYIIRKKKKKTQNELHECNAMQLVEIKEKTQKPKNKE